MKMLAKIFLTTGIIACCLVSAKIFIELIESNSKNYVEVE